MVINFFNICINEQLSNKLFFNTSFFFFEFRVFQTVAHKQPQKCQIRKSYPLESSSLLWFETQLMES